MSIATTDEPKKDEKKEKEFTKSTSEKNVFDEAVTFRYWSEGNKTWVNPQKGIKARRALVDGKKTIIIILNVGQKPSAGSEIEDADGNVYVVKKTEGGGNRFFCTVEKKEEMKP